MSLYAIDPQALADKISAVLGDKINNIQVALGEVTVEVPHQSYLEVATILRDHPDCQFEQLMDVCGLDYSTYKDGSHKGPRFAAVSHLLSISLNQRVRLKVFAPDDSLPVVASLTSIWSSANWFEREAFDLYGLVFEGHNDLRRILTDYGFVGHPFRKDFPTNGYVEMRYDEELKRVVYQPVSIELRENTPRIIREAGYGGAH